MRPLEKITRALRFGILILALPTVGHSAETGRGTVETLQSRLNEGKVDLAYEPSHGYLLGLLQYFKINSASQVLVFSKTSSLTTLISPTTPRAIYFSDNVYVAWIPDSKTIEISEADPAKGARFYTLSQKKKTCGDCERATPRMPRMPSEFAHAMGYRAPHDVRAYHY